MRVKSRSGTAVTEKRKGRKKKKVQFYKGQVFKTVQELEDFITGYNVSRNVKISKARTKSKEKSRVKDLQTELPFYEIDLQCQRSGKYVSKAKTNPPTRVNSCKTKKTNCPWKVTARIIGKKSLTIRKVSLKHNHESPCDSEESSDEDSSSEDNSALDEDLSPGQVDVGETLEPSSNNHQEATVENEHMLPEICDNEGDEEILLEMTVHDLSERTREIIKSGNCEHNVSSNALEKGFENILGADFVWSSTPRRNSENPSRSSSPGLESSQPNARYSDENKNQNTVPSFTPCIPPKGHLNTQDSPSSALQIQPVDLTRILEEPLDLSVSSVSCVPPIVQPSVPSIKTFTSSPANVTACNLKSSISKEVSKTFSSSCVASRGCESTEPGGEIVQQQKKTGETRFSRLGISQNLSSQSSTPTIGKPGDMSSMSNSTRLNIDKKTSSDAQFPSTSGISHRDPNTPKTSLAKLSQSALNELAGIKNVKKMGKPIGAPKGKRTNVIGVPLDKDRSVKKQLEHSPRPGATTIFVDERRGTSKRGMMNQSKPEKMTGRVAFNNRTDDMKIRILLKWLLMENYLEERNFMNCPLRKDEINLRNLNDAFIATKDKDLELLISYMEKDAYEEFLKTVEAKITNDDYKCGCCGVKNHEICKKVVCCHGCHLWYHLVCVNLKKVPPGKWWCVSCSQDE